LDRFKKIAADDGVRFVELYQPRADDLLSQDIARFYAPDGLHLTGDGYEVWYQKILETLGRDNPLRR
jgi:lysophospholipase L1-like esterase